MKESDIRPEELFNNFLKLAEQDSLDYFSDVTFQRISCPACEGNNLKHAFTKQGFDYEICNTCDSLFNNPRPPEEAIRRYFSEAPSIKYWATHFYKETEDARRERIFAPRAQAVVELISKIYPNKGLEDIKWIGDIGSGFGVFCEEMKKIVPKEVEVLAIEPSPPLAQICKNKGLTVIDTWLEDLQETDFPTTTGSNCILTAYEMIMHIHNPLEFFKTCKQILSPGDLLVFTGLNGMGLDILALWEKSSGVHPPHHINFFNPKSIEILLAKAGFKTYEVTTPGNLDVEILESCLEKLLPTHFWRYFLKQLNESGKIELQEFISKNKLSSHMMVIAQCL